ncbi:MetQ/NlpA family ABC transporter substrate-binding protein [Roseomonas sp. OT10]|uniref:MetQ/NlpA family ABC transporter substrate-binding protein n=1 Tax=Roseomonas cutis TaxID=2897332 RepID=UPI001E2DA4E1|nr:MetQ/NlpA family ABC transporter substrate-binding protein [Roseomonas sp. OT10]UFN48355.1 MetQ/NlpA family ABC transporter substrate-binding protein [Roseomonas sp. OT10]
MQRRSLILAAAGGMLLSRDALAQGGAAIGTAARPVRVGVTSGVHAQVLEQVRDVLARDNFVVKITEFGDFIQPNAALAAGDLDANTYQHQPFLDAQKAQRGYDFVPVGKTVLTVMAVFSRKLKSLADLPQGGRVAIPNDPTNGGRALLLLAQGGAITLAPGVDFRATVADITQNPKRLRFVELEAAQIARSLDDVDAAAITGNYAVPAGLNPLRDGLVKEGAESVYTCLVVVPRKDAEASWAKKLASGYAAPEIKAFVAEKFGGAVIVGA